MRALSHVAAAAMFFALLAGSGQVDAQRRARPAPPPPAPEEPAAPTPPPPDTARDFFARGQSAYQQGDYEAAIEQWARAYALEARPQLQYNLAQAYSRLGRVEEERAALELFVQNTRGDDPLLATARARLSMIDQRLARTGLTLHGDTYEGAVVVIDGEDRGRLPHPDAFTLRPGNHEVSVTLAGYAPFRATVVVPAGDAVSVNVTMTEIAVAASSSNGLVLPIALYGTGGALVITGAIFGGLALSRSDGAISGTSDADSARTFSIVADVTIGLGIAAAATGLVLHLTRGEDDEAPSTAILPIVGRDLVGVRAVGSF